IGENFHGPASFVQHGVMGPAFWLALAGVITAWFLYLKSPETTEAIATRLAGVQRLLINKYYFDDFNEKVLAAGSRGLGRLLWRTGDEVLIDGALVNGSARLVGWTAGVVRRVQSGYLYHYAFAMIIGLALLLGWTLLAD
ncbi:MAG: NADH-quinone oxidoreductase subunit L, partial [Chromatiales bacterium]|nr:NADH-quinone oxidoreductase subunit L [Chromatiales bacterium]